MNSESQIYDAVKVLREKGVDVSLWYTNGLFGMGAGYTYEVEESKVFDEIRTVLKKQHPNYVYEPSPSKRRTSLNIVKSADLLTLALDQAKANMETKAVLAKQTSTLPIVIFTIVSVLFGLYFKFFVTKPTF